MIGRAGLADLAQATAAALTARGITSVIVAVDDSLFGAGIGAEGWSSVDLTGGFVAPVSALAVDLGQIEGRTQSDADPPITAGRAFRDALREAGIDVRDLGRGDAPASGGQEVARVDSAPLRDLLAYAMQQSDNTLSEVFGRLVAIQAERPATFAGASEAVRDAVAALGVDVTGLVLRDASGLSSANRISPGILVDLLVVAGQRPDLLPVVTTMPVAGLEGTLSYRDLGEGTGIVRAKTGTLPNVVSLAGYTVTADGRLLAFAVMADGVPTAGSYAARLEIDAWVANLTACGCS